MLPTDERLLDRLVDGELTEPERRELLQRLDAAPEGWRACALAFLEAQAWKKEFRSLSAEQPARFVNDSEKLTPRSKHSTRHTPLSTLLAMAASFLLAFTLGLGVRGFFASHNAPPAVDLAAQPTQTGLISGRPPGPASPSVT